MSPEATKAAQLATIAQGHGKADVEIAKLAIFHDAGLTKVTGGREVIDNDAVRELALAAVGEHEVESEKGRKISKEGVQTPDSLVEAVIPGWPSQSDINAGGAVSIKAHTAAKKVVWRSLDPAANSKATRHFVDEGLTLVRTSGTGELAVPMAYVTKDPDLIDQDVMGPLVEKVHLASAKMHEEAGIRIARDPSLALLEDTARAALASANTEGPRLLEQAKAAEVERLVEDAENDDE